MVYYQEKLYVWGGTHGTNYPTDMYRFDVRPFACRGPLEDVGAILAYKPGDVIAKTFPLKDV